MNQKQFFSTALIGLALYFVSIGISFAIFSLFGKYSRKAAPQLVKTAPQQHFKVNPAAPKTEACPINGMMYTKDEKDIWAKRRPLAVMIENHEEARPQSGLSKADVVYEAVAEGGISRFMGIFYCGIAESVNLAPVRSARTYFLPWVLEYDALYNHVGGAGRCPDDTVDDRAKALCQIDQYRIKDMDQFGISFPTCYRNYDRLDHPVETEHTMVCVTDKLYELAADRGWTNLDAKGVSWNAHFLPWKFKDDAPAGGRGTFQSASFVAWKGYENGYGVRWDYDQNENVYKRFNGALAHLDLENKQQLTAKSVVIIFAKETGPVDSHLHLLYNNIGSGDGLLLQDGKVVKITWQKTDRNSRSEFVDERGKEINFNRGQIWIEMLPIGTPVTY